MNLIRHNPWDIISQMNEILDSSSRNGDRSNMSTSRWAPAVDIREEKDHYIIEADLPGVDKENIEIFMDNGCLSIKGERKEENKSEGSNYSRVERIYGRFHRQFSLPDTADNENINAAYENGVLKISIPKKEAAKPKRISITGSNSRPVLEHKQGEK
jgi:HSP20 family protein